MFEINLKHMKKSLLNILVLISIGLLGTSCSEVKKDTKNTVSVSILPQKFMVEQIAGDLLNINVMIPPGSSPASYEPTPMQVAQLESSKLYLRIGYIGFETSWMNRFKSVNSEMKIVNIANGIDLIEDGGHWHGDQYHAGIVEPHVWTSPKNVEIIANNIYQTLIAEYPQHKESFTENYSKFVLEISNIHGYALEQLSTLKNKKFLIYHPALSYLARDYGLEQIAMEHEGKEPSSKYLKTLIDQAHNENIGVVLIQKQFDQENAKALVKELDAKLITIDPLAENWTVNTKEIINILSNNLK